MSSLSPTAAKLAVGLLLLLSAAVPADSVESTWSGVYTASQAARGEAIYASVCGRCHGYLLNGAPDDPDMLPAPPIAGDKFLRKWNGTSLAALFEYTRTTMPAINPGSLSDQEFIDLLSYMLSVSAMPSGDEELPVEAARLEGLRLLARP